MEALPLILSGTSLFVSLCLGVWTARDRFVSRKMSRERVVATWAIKVLEAMSDAYHFIDSGRSSATSGAEREKILSQLSALIDEGRWYFPNEKSAIYGVHGLRDKVLDPPVAVYRVLAGIDPPPNDLNDYRRDFVTGLGKLIEPFPSR